MYFLGDYGLEGEKKWWYPLYEFGIHTIVGTGIFIFIASAAVGLDFLVTYLKRIEINGMIVMGLTLVEYTLFSVDLALFILFIVRAAINAGKSLWKL